MPGVMLHAPEAEVAATFLPGLGMLGCSLRHRGEELLALRDGVPAYAASGRLGHPAAVPVGEPARQRPLRARGRTIAIAGEPPLVRREEHGLAIHGLLAAHPGWRVDAEAAGEDGARLVASLDFGAHPELMERFPFPHGLEIAVELAHATLRVVTRVDATGRRGAGLLRLPPVLRPPGRAARRVGARAALAGAARARREPAAHRRARPRGRRAAPIGDRLFDDGYDGLVPAPPSGSPAAAAGSCSCSRPATRARRSSCRPATSRSCLEPMTAPTNALVEARRAPARPAGRAVRGGVEPHRRFLN